MAIVAMLVLVVTLIKVAWRALYGPSSLGSEGQLLEAGVVLFEVLGGAVEVVEKKEFRFRLGNHVYGDPDTLAFHGDRLREFVGGTAMISDFGFRLVAW